MTKTNPVSKKCQSVSLVQFNLLIIISSEKDLIGTVCRHSPFELVSLCHGNPHDRKSKHGLLHSGSIYHNKKHKLSRKHK